MQAKNYIFSTGGRNLYDGDKNVCTIQATAIALNKPFYEVKEKFESLGRRPKHGLTPSIMRIILVIYGIELSQMIERTEAKTLRQWTMDHPIGTYILLTKNHALTMKDGVIFDSYTPQWKKKVFWFAEVEPDTKMLQEKP